MTSFGKRPAGRLAGAALAGTLALSPACAADKINVGTPEATAFTFAIVDIGVQSGAFARNGIEVDRLDFAGSAKLHPAMATGAVDLAMGSGSDFLFTIKGVPEKAVAVFQNLPNDLTIVVRPGGPVKTLADMKGRKMGVAGPGGLGLWIAMSASSKQGWGPNGMTYAYLGTMPTIMASLLSSNVDVAVADIGIASRAEVEGKAQVLALGGEIVNPFIAHPVLASTELMEKRPDVLRRYLKGMLEAIAFAKTHEAEAIQMTMARTGYTADILKKVYAAVAPQFSSTGRFEPAAFVATRQALVELGVVKAEDMPPDSALFTEEFLPK